MASVSPWRCSLKPTTHNHFALFSNPEIYCKRNFLATFSSLSDDTSSSHLLDPDSSLSRTPTPNPNPSHPKESTNYVNPLASSDEDDLSIPEYGWFSRCDENPEVSSIPIQIPNKQSQIQILTYFSGSQRSLLRRIWFTSRKVKIIVLLNVITVVSASSIAALKEVESLTDPSIFNVVRFTVSAIPFVPFVFKSAGDVRIRNAGIELGLWVGLGYLTQAFGLLTSDAGRASFISSLTIIVVPLLDGLLGATLPFYAWFGAFMSLLGVALLESSGSPPCVGDLLNLSSAVFFGVHMLRTQHVSRTTEKGSFLAILGYELGVVVVLSMVWFVLGGCSGATNGYVSPSLSWTINWDWLLAFPWVPALYTGILSTGLCLWVEMSAMCDISATEAAIIYGLEPVWGAGFAWFLLGERWGESGWMGAAFVIVGSLMVQILGSSSQRLE